MFVTKSYSPLRSCVWSAAPSLCWRSWPWGSWEDLLPRGMRRSCWAVRPRWSVCLWSRARLTSAAHMLCWGIWKTVIQSDGLQTSAAHRVCWGIWKAVGLFPPVVRHKRQKFNTTHSEINSDIVSSNYVIIIRVIIINRKFTVRIGRMWNFIRIKYPPNFEYESHVYTYMWGVVWWL